MIRRHVSAFFQVVVVLVAAIALADDPRAPPLRVPDGFTIERVDEGNVRFPMFAAFDDRGRLFVAESSGLDLYAEISAATRKCRVRLLEDRDGDGKFETAKVFADKLVFPMGLAWRHEKLYVADPPDLVTYEDLDGDGAAEKRSVILSGFGHKDNGSLHGLVFGPDDRMYMTMGAPDGYKLRRSDGTVLEGTSGALIRCRPDGSFPEVLSRGFVNLVEVAFTVRGDKIGTDNWFQHPQDGYRDALVHLVDGGLYPYEPDTGTRFPVTGQPLPPVSMFPAVALSGLCTYRGVAFPAAMQGNLFSAQHNSRKVGRHVLVSDGSSFRANSFDFVWTDDPDFHPSDVLESADGSLIVIDTGSWYVQHCPTGRIRAAESKGGIYRMRATDVVVSEDPWGNSLDWGQLPVDRLVALLGDARPAVRDRAQRSLAAVGKGAVGRLANLLKDNAPLVAQQHAVWALAAIAEQEALSPLRSMLSSDEPDVVVPAARAIALREDRDSEPELVKLLKHPVPAVRLAAVEALARCGSAESLAPLWNALAEEPDAFLEHAIVHAIHHLADAAALEARLNDSHPRIAGAVMRLLDQPPRSPGLLRPEVVFRAVRARDEALRRTATDLLAHHPEWAEQVVNVLRDWVAIAEPTGEEQAGLRNVVLAFQRHTAVQDLVAAAISGHDRVTSAVQRQFLLSVIAESAIPELPRHWVSALAAALGDADQDVRHAAIRTAAILQVPELDDRIMKLAESESSSTDMRVEALRAVIRRRPKLSPAVFEFLATELRNSERPIVRLSTAEVFRDSQLTEEQLRQLLQIAQADALLAPSVLLPAVKRSSTAATDSLVLDYLVRSLERGWRPSEAELEEALKAIAPRQTGQTENIRRLHKKSIAGQQARLTGFEPLLHGGNVERGRQVFFGKKATCAACHRIAGEGGQVGPDLTKIGAIRSGRDLLESVILPSATIAQGYDPYVVMTQDGRAASGVIARQTSVILFMRDSSGAELRFRKDQIEDLQRTAISIMPEGLERPLTNEELRDLFAFLQSLK